MSIDSGVKRRTYWFRLLPAWIGIFGIFALTGLLQFAAVDWSRPLSIYDEVPHVDYVLRLAQGDVTTWDDVYSQRTLGLATCLEERSPDPQCISGQLRDPLDRWPNGRSYEAQQAPVGYLPFTAMELTLVNGQSDHYTQIRYLRLTNVILWLAFSGLWTVLILQVTSRYIAALAASVTVALNPLLFDRFTYVTNDSSAIIAATAVVAWLLYLLRQVRPIPWGVWLAPSVLLGASLGLIKPTALVAVTPVALAVAISAVAHRHPGAPARWWISLASVTTSAAASALMYKTYIESRSELDFDSVIGLMLPRAPLDFATAALLRLTDMGELIVGTGARTGVDEFEWGVRFPSIWVVLFSLVGVMAFLASFALRNGAFTRQPLLDSRIWGYAVAAGIVITLIVHPALHFLEGGFVVPFSTSRFLAPLVPLAGIALLPAFERWRLWALSIVAFGVAIAAFGSAPIDRYIENLRFLS